MVHSINPLVSPSSMRGKETVVEETNGDDIDLNLSLSLNGRFGVDPQRNHKITGSSSPKVLITPHQRSSAEIKMWSFFPTCPGVQEAGTLMDTNRRRSVESSGSSTITNYFQNQIIEGGQGFPANIGRSADQNRAKPAEKAKGREFNRIEDMPNVYTTISGPMIKGYLAKYNDQEIRILCACHAFPMTPAQFIKHAGGGDVAFPERYITVKLPVGDGDVANP